VDAHDLLARHGEHAEREVLAQRLLRGERQLGQVGEVPHVVGVHAGGVERGLVVGNVGVGMPDRPFEPVKLERAQFVKGSALDRLNVRIRGNGLRHGRTFSQSRNRGPPRPEAAAAQKDNVDHLVSIGDVSPSGFDHIADTAGLLADAKYRRCGGFTAWQRVSHLPSARISRYNRGDEHPQQPLEIR